MQYSNPFWVHGHVPPLKGGTCTVTHEEGYETAEKKRVHDLKREASRMEEVMTNYQHITG